MRSSALALVLLVCGCAAEPAVVGIPCVPGAPASGDVSFDPGSMLCVQITMDEDEHAQLLEQYRFPGGEEDQWPGVIATTARSCSEPYPSEFTYFYADIAVDGRALEDVGIRKKGFLGSVEGAGDRPSLKLKTDKYIDHQTLGDTERITLNNNHQDRSRIRTCLAYSVFDDAGYPAPRCNLANVSVNGTALGTYTHVEAIKKRFLRRAFGNDEGALYEGTLADFTGPHLAGLPASLGRWEAKTSDTDPTGEGLGRIADALQAPDDELEQALGEVLDIDAFVQFWALETLVGHDDGYNENTNNAYVYLDPDRGGRAVFIPWGADDVHYGYEDPNDEPAYVTSELARRLSRHPDLRQRYLDELQRLLDEIWDEEAMHERIDRYSVLVASAEEDLEPHLARIAYTRDRVDERRAVMQAFIDAGGAEGGPETRPCTGNREPEDFLALGEVVAVSAMGCSATPVTAERSGIIAAVLTAWLTVRSRRCRRSS